MSNWPNKWRAGRRLACPCASGPDWRALLVPRMTKLVLSASSGASPAVDTMAAKQFARSGSVNRRTGRSWLE